jgi:5-methylthioribose kinase
MRKFIISLIIILVPIYLIASDQQQKKTLQQATDSPATKVVEKLQTPVSAPSMLNDYDKKVFEDIKDFRNKVPENIKKELEAFSTEKRKLNEARKKLYDDLSKDAKQIMSKEKALKKKLTPEGKKIAREL